MKEVNDIQKLVRRQKSFQKGILVMAQKLFDIQNQIATLTIKELSKNNKQDKEESAFLSAKEVCKEYKMSQSTLYRMRVYNGFPCMKVEGRKSIMFKKREIDEYFINLNKRNP